MIYRDIVNAKAESRRLLAILVDPEKFDRSTAAIFLRNLPSETTHIFVGGSTVPMGQTGALVNELKLFTSKPIVIFPGHYSQISKSADALLFLSLLSGDNPEYLVGQQLASVPILRKTTLEVIPTAYILIDGGITSSVEKVSRTKPIRQDEIGRIVDTAVAGELMGKKMVYLEAGSGALSPVGPQIIEAVKNELEIPLLVGGGIRTAQQKEMAYHAGADMVVMGTAFERD